MRCEICGSPLDHPGQGHTCRRDRAVPGAAAETFALATRRVVRFGAVYAVVVVVITLLGLAGYTAVRLGAADAVDAGTQMTVLVGSMMAGLVGLVCAIGVLISTVVWIVSAHRLTPGGPGVAGYGGLVLCLVVFGASCLLPLLVPSLAGAVLTEAGLRITGIVVLLAGVFAARARLRRATGEATLAGRPPLITSDDWDASRWDPEVMRDIERRRRSAD